MIKNNFYIITGGPGGGKTTLLEHFRLKGYPCVPETARQIIKDRKSLGLPPRPDPLTFAIEIFRKDWSNYNSHIDKGPTFFDRSFIDSAWQIFTADKKEYSFIEETYLSNRYNKKVFIAPPWKEIFQTDNERDQSFDEAIEVYEELYEWYTILGYELFVLPKDSIENRAGFILDQIT